MKIINSKIFKILVVTLVIGFIIGIISFIFMDKSSLQSSIIWISGIIFFCSLVIPLIIIYRGISLSLTISTIIYT